MDNHFTFTITPNNKGLFVSEISGYTIGDAPENFTITIENIITDKDFIILKK